MPGTAASAPNGRGRLSDLRTAETRPEADTTAGSVGAGRESAHSAQLAGWQADGVGATDRDAADGAHAAAVFAVEEGIADLVIMMRDRWKTLAQEVDPRLQPIGFRIVTALYAGGPQRAKDLVDRLGSNKSVLSRQFSQLQELGLVERRVDPDDGRVIHMAVTEAAARRLVDIARHDSRSHIRKLSTWPTQRLQEFASMLEDFSDADDD